MSTFERTTVQNAALVLVALAGMLSATACGNAKKPATGLLVDLATAPEHCGDGRNIVAIAVGQHRARLNAETDMPIERIGKRLHEVQRYRAEKLTYVTAEADVPWGEFLELVDRVWSESDLVSLITPKVKALAEQRICLAPSCGQCEMLRRSRGR